MGIFKKSTVTTMAFQDQSTGNPYRVSDVKFDEIFKFVVIKALFVVAKFFLLLFQAIL